MFRCYGSRSAAAENSTQNCFASNAFSQWLRVCKMRVGARFFRLKYGQQKCDRRALNTHSFQKRKYAARQLTFPVHWLRFSSRYILRVSCKNRLTKPRVCGIILSASERVSTRSKQIFRGIAQLVEQRSPNGNRDLIFRINTGLLRLETSVSSLFSCFWFCKSLKWFMQNRGQNLQKISEQHQKASNISFAIQN